MLIVVPLVKRCPSFRRESAAPTTVDADIQRQRLASVQLNAQPVSAAHPVWRVLLALLAQIVLAGRLTSPQRQQFGISRVAIIPLWASTMSWQTDQNAVSARVWASLPWLSSISSA